MDIRILQKIGLTPGEIKAYLALLKLGSSSTGPIATKSGVSRSKLYVILEKLSKKGLVSHVDKKNIRYFHAVEPSKISDYLHEQQTELKRLEAEFKEFLPELQAYHDKKDSSHKIYVYSGFKAIKTAHEHTYLKLKRGDEYVVLSVPRHVSWDALTFWEKDHLRRSKLGIGCRLLFNRDVDRKVLDNRNSFKHTDARYMPTDLKTPTYFTIYKDTTLITIPSDSEPIGIEIVSADVTKAFKAYFDEFWKKSKPIK